jgi:ethanolamine utilization protein EutN
MNLGIVKGTVTATVKHRVYEHRTLMVVALCTPDWIETGRETLAIDTVQAGVGDRVMTLKEGNSARAIFGDGELPMQEMIVAIVDAVYRGSDDAGERSR